MVTPASVKDAALVHGGFLLLALVGVFLPIAPLGWRLFGLVVVYGVALVAVSATRRPEWRPLVRFLVPLSVFQVVPDWFLSQELEVLVFPDTGGPRIGTVTGAMAGMWTIPLFISVFGAEVVCARRGVPDEDWSTPALLTAAIALALFTASEATLWALPLWFAKGVTQVARVAVYVLPAEALLGAATFVGFRATRERGLGAAIGAAAIVSMLYLGALATSYFFVERLR
ncbi:MAG: hypothetical protein MUC96_06895 [Myxococcaceae bacterium]|nr:hypothetical protein [Myxococcaceae bacterium]